MRLIGKIIMTTLNRLFIVSLLCSSTAFANCDITQFRWECDIPIKRKPSHHHKSLVYCGNSYGYLSKDEYDRLNRFHRRNINMVLKIHGEYMDSPCIPAHR